MSLLQEAVVLNNNGVSELLDGNYESASKSIMQAIVTMKDELSECDLCSTTTTADLNDDTTTSGDIQMHPVRITDTSSSSSSDGSSVRFCQAFTIPSERICDCNDDSQRSVDRNFYAGAIIFNLALIYHLQQVVPSSKAEKLYNMALNLLDDRIAFSNARTALLIKLACIDNLCQLRYSQGDNKSAQEGRDQVERLVRRTPRSIIVGAIEEPEIRGLLMSVLILEAPHVAAAA